MPSGLAVAPTPGHAHNPRRAARVTNAFRPSGHCHGTSPGKLEEGQGHQCLSAFRSLPQRQAQGIELPRQVTNAFRPSGHCHPGSKALPVGRSSHQCLSAFRSLPHRDVVEKIKGSVVTNAFRPSGHCHQQAVRGQQLAQGSPMPFGLPVTATTEKTISAARVVKSPMPFGLPVTATIFAEVKRQIVGIVTNAFRPSGHCHISWR